jgi:hypothetical protein
LGGGSFFLSFLVVGWWLPLLDALLFHYGMWTSDEATAVVVSYTMFVFASRRKTSAARRFD